MRPLHAALAARILEFFEKFGHYTACLAEPYSATAFKMTDTVHVTGDSVLRGIDAQIQGNADIHMV